MPTFTGERRRGASAPELVEYQMRFREIVDRAAGDMSARRPVPAPTTLGPYLTISREAGSGGAELARRIGNRLGWAVLDKELVNGLAEDLKLQPRVLDLMDETRSNWFSDTLLNLFNSRLVLQDSYVALVGKVVALAASEGRTVFVGRGANLILPPEHGVRVRVIAPRELRVQRLSLEEHLDERAAEKRVIEIDDNRQDFIRRHFRRDVTDSSAYDLVVNTGSLGIDGSTEVILRALEIRGFTSA